MLTTMHRAALVLLLASPCTSRAQSAARPAKAAIATVAWLAGTWVSSTARETVEEHWTAPGGGAMLAVSRTIAGGKLTEFEFLRIVGRGGGLVDIAQPNGRPPTEFAMTRIEAQSVTFENPQHDFPKMIRYEKRSDGTLVASIGGAKGARPISWVFVRKSADSR